MSTTIRELLVRLGVDDGDSAAVVSTLDNALEDLIDVGTKAVAVATAVTVAFGGIVASAAGAADAVDKGSTAAAISTDAYQELNFIAGQMGTNIETVTKALGKQTTALGQLQDGAGPAGEALGELGLTYEYLAGLSADEQLLATANALSQVTNEQERLQLATAIYGEDMAQQLMPLLSASGSELEAMAQQAHDLGLVLSEDSVAAGVLFTDTLDQVLGVAKGLKNLIGLSLLPALTDLLTRLRDWYSANSQLIAQRLASWVEVIAAGIERLVSWVGLADEAVQRVFGGWEPILIAAAGLVATVGAAIAALAGLKAWFAIEAAIAAIGTIGAATFGWIVAAIVGATAAVVGLGLVIDDLVTYFQGGQSAIGDFIERFREADGYLGAAARTLELLLGIGARVVDIVMKLGEVWWTVFSATTLPVLEALLGALIAVAEVGLGGIAWWADNVVIPALQMVLQVLDGISAGIGAAAGFLGIDVGGAAGADAGAAAASIDTSAFAPTTTTSTTTTTQADTTVTVQGSSLSVTGVGLSAEDVTALFQQLMDEQARSTAAALAGAEV